MSVAAVDPSRPNAEATSLFVADGNHWRPTEWSRGPWDPGALHGGPVAALMARELERIDSPGPMHPARLTIELLRPAPLAPLAVAAEVVRPGRKVQLVEITVTLADGTVRAPVARAIALRIRRDPNLYPPSEGAKTDVLAPPEEGHPPVFWREDEPIGFHNGATEHRILSGGFDVPGPTVDWIRLRVPVVPDEVPSPLQRTVAAADFGNGISSVLDVERYPFVTPDLTVTLPRLPEGEWVGLDAVTHLGPDGIAVAESVLHDRGGRIGRAVQTLLIDGR
jgi:hypothetical protein